MNELYAVYELNSEQTPPTAVAQPIPRDEKLHGALTVCPVAWLCFLEVGAHAPLAHNRFSTCTSTSCVCHFVSSSLLRNAHRYPPAPYLSACRRCPTWPTRDLFTRTQPSNRPSNTLTPTHRVLHTLCVVVSQYINLTLPPKIFGMGRNPEQRYHKDCPSRQQLHSLLRCSSSEVSMAKDSSCRRRQLDSCRLAGSLESPISCRSKQFWCSLSQHIFDTHFCIEK